MKVKTLIKKLQKMNPNQKVVLKATGNSFGVDVDNVGEKFLSEEGNLFSKRVAKDWDNTIPVIMIEGLV